MRGHVTKIKMKGGRGRMAFAITLRGPKTDEELLEEVTHLPCEL